MDSGGRSLERDQYQRQLASRDMEMKSLMKALQHTEGSDLAQRSTESRKVQVLLSSIEQLRSERNEAREQLAHERRNRPQTMLELEQRCRLQRVWIEALGAALQRYVGGGAERAERLALQQAEALNDPHVVKALRLQMLPLTPPKAGPFATPAAASVPTEPTLRTRSRSRRRPTSASGSERWAWQDNRPEIAELEAQLEAQQDAHATGARRYEEALAGLQDKVRTLSVYEQKHVQWKRKKQVLREEVVRLQDELADSERETKILTDQVRQLQIRSDKYLDMLRDAQRRQQLVPVYDSFVTEAGAVTLRD